MWNRHNLPPSVVASDARTMWSVGSAAAVYGFQPMYPGGGAGGAIKRVMSHTQAHLDYLTYNKSLREVHNYSPNTH